MTTQDYIIYIYISVYAYDTKLLAEQKNSAQDEQDLTQHNPVT